MVAQVEEVDDTMADREVSVIGVLSHLLVIQKELVEVVIFMLVS